MFLHLSVILFTAGGMSAGDPQDQRQTPPGPEADISPPRETRPMQRTVRIPLHSCFGNRIWPCVPTRGKQTKFDELLFSWLILCKGSFTLHILQMCILHTSRFEGVYPYWWLIEIPHWFKVTYFPKMLGSLTKRGEKNSHQFVSSLPTARKVMFSQVSVCPQSASWILLQCSALLWRGRYASYWNAFSFIVILLI